MDGEALKGLDDKRLVRTIENEENVSEENSEEFREEIVYLL
jgi:hypothetical protein